MLLTGGKLIVAVYILIVNKYEKHFQQMYRDVGMAVPKTTETRCRDGSVQGRHVIQDYTTNPIPTSFFISEIILRVMLQDYWEEQFLSQKKRCRDGVSCVVFV